MCGIAGVLSRDGGAPIRAVEDMQAALLHRGPDDRGVWHATSGRAAFAHTRLAVIDLSPNGHQPMSTPDGRLTITFNGEIYNYAELRQSLRQRGAEFTTGTDTEVILRAYELDGVDCLPRLRGMFAFAIWDERTQQCLLARDRFGIKPLYVHGTPDRLVFASEVRALVRSGLIEPRLNEHGVLGYLRTGSVPEPLTLLDGVTCVEPGHYTIWSPARSVTSPYWELRFGVSGDDRPMAEVVAATRSSLIDAVRHHFVSDTPVGVFLSGGLDSTAVLALSATVCEDRLHTFSLAFPGLPSDEGPLARRTAEHFGTEHHEWAIDGGSGRRLFDEFLRAADQPSIDGLNTLAVSQFARECGMKVVLSGLGGDEVFGGYPSFRAVPSMHRWNRAAAVTGPVRRAVGSSLQRLGADPKVHRIGELLSGPPALENAYAAYRGVFTRREAAMLLTRYGLADPGEDQSPRPACADPTPADCISRLELTRYMRNQLLRDSDTMSMSRGLELRVPLLDGELVQQVSALSASIRLKRNKALLRAAVPEIPEWIATQPKRGFLLPIDRWLDAEWTETFADGDRTSVVPLRSWYRRWSVYVLDRWVERLKGQRHA